MKKLQCLDAEYMIEKDPENNDSLILVVRSKNLDANCAARIDDKYLSTATCESIMSIISIMEDNMVYAANNKLLVSVENA